MPSLLYKEQTMSRKLVFTITLFMLVLLPLQSALAAQNSPGTEL
jgi:hypothetical protein